MLIYRVIFYLSLLPQLAAASLLNVTNIKDPVVNQPLVQLVSNESYSGLEQRQLTSTGLNALLAYMAPQIKKLPGYTGLFVANCSIFINTQVDEVNCEIVPVASVVLQGGYQVAPGPRLPPQYGSQITRSSILLVSMFADWTRKKTEFSEQYELVLYDRVWTCSKTVTVDSLTKPQTSSVSHSHTLSNTMSAFLSESKSFSGTFVLTPTLSQSRTTSKTTSRTLSVDLSQSASQTTLTQSRSLSQSLLESLSKSFSRTLSRSQSATLSSSSTASLSSSQTASQILTLSDTITPSLSLSVTTPNSLSSSMTQTPTKTPTPVCQNSVAPTNGLLSAWSRTTGVYADATSQTNRYTTFNNVVTDTLTNMQWEQTAGTTPMVFASVSGYCAAQTTGGLTGWRAPNIVELGTLVDYMIAYNTPPQINLVAFPGAPASNFWSASLDIGNSGNSWFLRSSSESISYYQTTGTTSPVRCVRSCYPTASSSRYTVGTGASTGTVTDNVTKLIWQKVAPTTGGPNSNGTYTWSGAAGYCSGLSLGGFSSGWRLPTIRELATLVDYSASNGSLMMDATVFAGEPANYFWSSTPVAGGPTGAWLAIFNNGVLGYGNVADSYYVRCLR